MSDMCRTPTQLEMCQTHNCFVFLVISEHQEMLEHTNSTKQYLAPVIYSLQFSLFFHQMNRKYYKTILELSLQISSLKSKILHTQIFKMKGERESQEDANGCLKIGLPMHSNVQRNSKQSSNPQNLPNLASTAFNALLSCQREICFSNVSL